MIDEVEEVVKAVDAVSVRELEFFLSSIHLFSDANIVYQHKCGFDLATFAFNLALRRGTSHQARQLFKVICEYRLSVLSTLISV